jgi:hypothetical protein
MDFQIPYCFGYRDSSPLRYDKMANFDDRANEHVSLVTFMGCIAPEKVIGKDKGSTETRSRWVIIFYYVNRLVNISFM